MKASKSAYQGIDDLRALATVAVIVLHVSAGLVEQFGKVSYDQWISGFLFNTISRFAVPIFVMISGALLLSKDYPLTVFLQKRVVRIIVPFLFYAVIYITYYWIIRLIFGNQNSLTQTTDWAITLIRKGIVYHFWFVYMILSLYLFAPILGKWIRNSSEKEIFYFLLLWMFSNLMTFPFFKNVHFKVELSHFAGYIGYFVLGYYLSNREISATYRIRMVGILLFTLGLVITILPTLYQSYLLHDPSAILVSYFYPNLIMMAVGIYLYFRYSVFRLTYIERYKVIVCKHSYGIFLIHILVLKWLSMVGIHWNFTHPLIAIPTTAIVCLALSSLFVFGVSKLPFGKYLAG